MRTDELSLDDEQDDEFDLDLRVSPGWFPSLPEVGMSGTCDCPESEEPGGTCAFSCPHTCGGNCTYSPVDPECAQ